MSYAANRVIAQALTAPQAEGAALAGEAVGDMTISDFRSIAETIAAGLEHTDDIDSVDHAKIGRFFTQRIYDYAKKCNAQHIKRAEDQDAAQAREDRKNDALYSGWKQDRLEDAA